MTPTLSILICTIKSRQLLCGRLLNILRPQRRDDVEILADEDDGDITIGKKRNRLLENSTGKYVAFIDDDDTVAPNYAALLVSALSTNPDCVGFRANWYTDGALYGLASYTIQNEQRTEVPIAGEKFNVLRQPGHLTPIRRDIALAVKFNEWNYGEDADYSIRCRPHLSREVFVDEVVYHYWLRSSHMRGAEKVHPDRWQDGNFRIERSLKAAAETRRQMNQETVPPDTDR
jgi:glycosyltransferase involved in cell wall biosynthesis